MQQRPGWAKGASQRRSSRAGEMEAKTIVLLIVGGIGGLALLGCVGIVVLVYAVMPRMQAAVQQARAAAQASMSHNNLKMMGLALHNYHDAVRSFPPGGVYAADGTPHHSWQTMLLPYVNQAALYNAVDFNLPWTDPANAPMFATLVPEYVNPAEQALISAPGGAVSHYAGNQHVLFENSHVSIQDVIDGSSNTMLAAEVAAGYRAWGDPSNVRDPAAGILRDASTFGSPANPNACSILLLDGSVRDVSNSISPDVLKALSTPAGGEPPPVF